MTMLWNPSRLWIFIGITAPVAVASIVSAILADNLLVACVPAFALIMWFVLLVFIVRRKPAARTKGRKTEKTINPVVTEGIFWGAISAFAAVNLIRTIAGDKELFHILWEIWWILIGLGHLLFFRIYPVKSQTAKH